MKNFIKNIINNDIVRRCVKTFIQAFCASIAVSLKGITTIDKAFIQSVLIAAISAGICAVMNVIIQRLSKDEKVEGKVKVVK